MVKMLERESVSISKLRTATLLFIHSLYCTVGSQLTHFWSREHTSSLLKQGKNPLRVWKWEEEKGLFCVRGSGGKKRDVFLVRITAGSKVLCDNSRFSLVMRLKFEITSVIFSFVFAERRQAATQ